MQSEVFEVNGISERPKCGWGMVNREKIKECERRIVDLENKYNISIFFALSTLVGIVVNIFLTMGK